jgi:hypothetical protein
MAKLNMSDHFSPYSLSSAQKYNANCTFTFPSNTLFYYEGLREDRGSETFALTVLQIQEDLGFEEHEQDGKMGRQTYTMLLEDSDPVTKSYIIYDTRRVPVSCSDSYTLVAYDQEGGLDLHDAGKFSKRKRGVNAVCFHWGGLDADHCYRVFQSRDASSHFLIGLKDGQATVYQTLDIKHKAWHGGWVNDWTIGIDICQQPGVKWLDHYHSKGYDVEVIPNPSRRGHKEILSLDPRLAKAAQDFTRDMMTALDIPIHRLDSEEVHRDDIERYSLFCHGHVNNRKWDILPWWYAVFSE